MNNKHITQLLDEFALNSLDERDLSTIKMHAAECESCRQSFDAAAASAALLKIHAAGTFEPSPFFETKLMAVWREKQIKSVAAFWRWWQASNVVVAAMIFTVAALLFVTLLAPNASNKQFEQASIPDSYLTEEIIFDQNDSTAELTNGQALQIIYEQQK